MANLGAAVCGGFCVSGSLSRSTVNASSGAATGLTSGLIAVLVVIATLQFATVLFRPLPLTTLAAIIMSALVSIISEVGKPVQLMRVKRSDAFVWFTAFVSVLSFGVDVGIIVGVFVNVFVVIARLSSPYYCVLGLVPETGLYRDISRYGECLSIPGVLILRFEASLIYTNADYFSTVVQEEVAASCASTDGDTSSLRCLILSAKCINDIDSAGVDTILNLTADLKKKEISLVLAGVKGRVRDVLHRGNYKETIFVSVHDAVVAMTNREGVSDVEDVAVDIVTEEVERTEV